MTHIMCLEVAMKIDRKTIYAQSSDIKSRTYLEYRKDMKKKAIVELEIIDWLEKTLSEYYHAEVSVKKSGSDKYVWFLRKGSISGEADFIAEFDGKTENYEFQYSETDDLPYFDFKVSKVGKKVKNTRIPFTDKKFIYIIKSSSKYGIIEPEWIINNGVEAGVPAWGNRTAFRVPNDRFLQILNTADDLKPILEIVDQKIDILNFQSDFIKIEEQKLSNLLQEVIDKNKILQIMPNDLDSFFKVCFIIDRMNEIPVNANLWLVYLLSFYNEKLNSYQVAQLIYCIDFLYSKVELSKNEVDKVLEVLQAIKIYSEKNQKSDGRIETSLKLTPIDDLRNFLFIVNLLEDLIQDSIFNYNAKFKPIERIFENVKNISNISKIILI